MNKNYIIKKGLSITIKFLIAFAAILGTILISKSAQHFFDDNIWYFTVQSNLILAAVALLFLAFDIVSLIKKTDLIVAAKFESLRLASVFFIFITGVVFNCLLAPLQFDNTGSIYNFSSVLLHCVTPVLAILDWIFFLGKDNLKKTNIFYWILYPLAYLFISNSRVAYYPEFVKYPYFFMDPAWNNQGVMMVVLWISAMILVFGALGYLSIILDKKIRSIQNKKLN